jgi:hypothetical protein
MAEEKTCRIMVLMLLPPPILRHTRRLLAIVQISVRLIPCDYCIEQVIHEPDRLPVIVPNPPRPMELNQYQQPLIAAPNRGHVVQSDHNNAYGNDSGAGLYGYGQSSS